MFRSKNKFRLCNLAFIMIIILSLAALYFSMRIKEERLYYAVCKNNNTTGVQRPPAVQKEEPAARLIKDGFRLEIAISKQWAESEVQNMAGAQYDAVFYNDTGKDLTDWVMTLYLPEGSRLDSYWNGQYSLDNSVITIEPVDYTQTIYAGDDITFGFILLTPAYAYHIEDCMIVFRQEVKLWQNPLFYLVLLLLLAMLLTDILYAVMRTKIKQYNRKQAADRKIISQSFRTFANIIDAKDMYTKGHSWRVASYSREIARRMGMTEETQEQIYYIGLLHDIGKIGITDNILNKPEQLTAEEMEIIRQHVTIGGDILKDFTSIPGIAEGALYHHERFDGTGYDAELAGSQIPLFARIICVADAFDAMSSARCYRDRLPLSYIINEFKVHAGTQFDPVIAKYMLDMINDGFAPIILNEEEADRNC